MAQHPQDSRMVRGSGAMLEARDAPEDATTFMFRNVPRQYSGLTLLREIERVVGADSVDLVFLAWDGKVRNMGYAFVNFADSRVACLAIRKMNGQRWRSSGTSRPINMLQARVQGLAANLIHLQQMIMRVPGKPVYPLIRLNGQPVEYYEALRRLGVDNALVADPEEARRQGEQPQDMEPQQLRSGCGEPQTHQCQPQPEAQRDWSYMAEQRAVQIGQRVQSRSGMPPFAPQLRQASPTSWVGVGLDQREGSWANGMGADPQLNNDGDGWKDDVLHLPPYSENIALVEHRAQRLRRSPGLEVQQPCAMAWAMGSRHDPSVRTSTAAAGTEYGTGPNQTVPSQRSPGAAADARSAILSSQGYLESRREVRYKLAALLSQTMTAPH